MESDSCSSTSTNAHLSNILVVDSHNLDQNTLKKNVARLNKPKHPQDDKGSKRKREDEQDVLYKICEKTNRVIPSASAFWKIFKTEGILIPMRTHRGDVTLRSLRLDGKAGPYWAEVSFL